MTREWGYAAGITSALLFGISTTFNKIVLGTLHPMAVTALIYLTGGLVLIVFRGLFSPLETAVRSKTRNHVKERFTGRDYVILALVILSGVVLAPYLFLSGLKATTAVNTSLLGNMEPLFTALIAYLLLRERGSRRDYIAMTVILLGSVALTTNLDFAELRLTERLTGNLLVVGGTFFWGIDNNLSRLLSVRGNLVKIASWKGLFGGLTVLALTIYLGIPLNVTLSIVPYLLVVGVLSIGVSILLFLFALQQIGAMRTGVIFSISSLFGAAFAFIVLSEPFSPIQAFAGLAMMFGVFLLVSEPTEAKKDLRKPPS
ncbi:MAG: DMT family transporter [Candidatus Geothermarchaeales archaeon]